MACVPGIASISVGCGGGAISSKAAAAPPSAGTPAPPPPPPPTPPPPTPPPPSLPSLPQSWTLADLPPIAGGSAAQANALNNSPHIVGYSVSNESVHATLWVNGVASDIGGPGTFANGINDYDQIVGYRQDASFVAHAHLWPDDIDSLSSHPCLTLARGALTGPGPSLRARFAARPSTVLRPDPSPCCLLLHFPLTVIAVASSAGFLRRAARVSPVDTSSFSPCRR